MWQEGEKPPAFEGLELAEGDELIAVGDWQAAPRAEPLGALLATLQPPNSELAPNSSDASSSDGAHPSPAPLTPTAPERTPS
jgi:hypothetical protein